jgi:uncharacterized protein (TIGR02270 family)
LAQVLETVVRQHAEEATMLRHQRTELVRAPHIGLLMLSRHDKRIAAHLEGLAVAGAAGTLHAAAVLEESIPGAAAGEAFALGVSLITAGDANGLDSLAARCEAQPDLQRGLASSLGWVSAGLLRGIVKDWLEAGASAKRMSALAACAMHRVDPGPALAPALACPEPSVRAAALLTAGRVGRVDLLPAIGDAMTDGDATVAFWAAWAACRLGDRAASIRVLSDAALSTSGFADVALALLMCALPEPKAHEFARHVAATGKTDGTAAHQRRLTQTLGLLGDTRFVPWLIERMDERMLARPAGEAFSAITGADLSALLLERLDGPPGTGPAEGAPPTTTADDGATLEVAQDADAFPGEDDEPIELDPDRDLPWPNRALVAKWWQQQPMARVGSPQRCFVGRPFGEAAWQHVLREGNQRQRALASLHLAVHAPASRMFQVAAPAWRQRRWLGTEPA